MVEREPSKLGVAGSNPVSRSKTRPWAVGRRSQRWFDLRKSSVAHVAQSVEHFLGKEEVMGSIPVMGFETFASNIRFEGCRVK